jgi:hypothetical protein
MTKCVLDVEGKRQSEKRNRSPLMVYETRLQIGEIASESSLKRDDIQMESFLQYFTIRNCALLDRRKRGDTNRRGRDICTVTW